jgi:RNA polymerase sigma-70 factor (ECF subfamily)
MIMESAKRFQPEAYRTYLFIWARVCLRKTDHLQSKLDASDIVQEALLQAQIALNEFRGETEHEFTAWLREILQNKLWDQKKYYERGKRDVKREQALCESLRESSVRFGRVLENIAADQMTPSQYVASQEKARLLAEALAALPDDQRTALELRHLGSLSLQETAKFLNKTTASVAGLLRRGLVAMRQSLKDHEKDLR